MELEYWMKPAIVVGDGALYSIQPGMQAALSREQPYRPKGHSFTVPVPTTLSPGTSPCGPSIAATCTKHPASVSPV
jgi:hypothetical protein